MTEPESITSLETKTRPWWLRIPLTLQIVVALALAVSLGIALGAGNPSPSNATLITNLAIPAELVLKALRALATPLILVAVLHTFMTTNIPGTAGRRLAVLLLTNTTAAILIGLLVANVLHPGSWGNLTAPTDTQAPTASLDPWGLFKDAVPDAILKPLVDNNVIQLIVIALSFGIVLRALKSEQIVEGKTAYQPIEDVIGILFEAVIRILNWVIALIPLAVFGIVAKTVAEKGFAPFQSLAAFIVAVLVALFLQACYYLTRVQIGSWVNPIAFLKGGSDAFLTAFSTSSSTVTMPITFEVLQTKIGLRESSASLGALVGANFNNDGTALYEAMSALYISQILGQHLGLGQQLIVVLTSIFASVGAAGIPNAGLVTMTLVFTSVGLPTQYIALLVTVDWFLDRCRTALNVMGDMTVSALLDGKKPRYLDEA
ncbi:MULTISPECIES: dicarboxylate/amino acid:cation symporter [unclassified Tolypothrix]|uniref:dicarboxylate/amino acid:cation symporter n=1 Tax=unclassified Tolypothrix TaxID=2649714 RepID=UPI0005EAB15B|nr:MULTISPECIES: dicarboxylate/amino acid:cation symporter [unclassified Tolypothrix]BAY88738.1 sodium:dicarboxylate symporter [Microchaete diplosiphon NIES-3275]EKF01620.1 transporter, dicarboxylate/amino acid:cation symporter family protein [Tolypothrix sp. PCC 7601]MBE9087712.1 dicarboxylate/amino acid:cation symporter [Tolypothrix sp. LEGE 11397]UYD29399.1 dicarboxylate/amino acid:cation symporter [Tolypothrix sp. PCC 7712]UYD34694.1 dicarboxylate/amino acid:cation symporter [Tolypothrix s